MNNKNKDSLSFYFLSYKRSWNLRIAKKLCKKAAVFFPKTEFFNHSDYGFLVEIFYDHDGEYSEHPAFDLLYKDFMYEHTEYSEFSMKYVGPALVAKNIFKGLRNN